MAVHEFAVPRVALDDAEPMVLSGWLLDEGTEVRDGDPVLEVETSKASMEIESPRDGVLAVHLRRPGDTVAAGEVIALIADPGEPYDAEALRRDRLIAADAAPAGAPAGARGASEGVSGARTNAGEAAPATASATAPAAAAHGAPARDVSVHDAPSHDVPARGVPGRGVPAHGAPAVPEPAPLLAVTAPASAEPSTPARAAGSPALAGAASLPVPAGFLVGPAFVPAATRAVAIPAVAEGPVPEPLSSHRVAVGRLMTASAAVPQFPVQLDAEVAEAERLVERLRAAGIAATFTDVLLKAAALTLARHPSYNAWLSGGALLRHERVSIGLAADGPAGVIAPVVHDVGRRGWRSLAAERASVVAGAREGRLRAEHLAGGTFSISNIGPLGAEAIVPLLSPPQVGILGIGRIRDAAGRRMMTTVLVSDHRAADGADAARFLTTFAGLLAAPDRLTFDD